MTIYRIMLLLMLAVASLLAANELQPTAHAQSSVVKHPLAAELFAAARADDANLIRKLLDRGVQVDVRNGQGRTALLIATHANSVNAARALIEAGADVNAKDNIEDSPYLYAGAEGRLDILKMTVAAGADLKSVNRYGGTALTPAAHHGHVEVVRYLLSTKIDIDLVNKLGWTALLEAVILGDGSPTYQKIVELLLRAGANTSIADKEGVLPIEHARSQGYREIVALIQNTKPDRK